jgi:hypothetical protein
MSKNIRGSFVPDRALVNKPRRMRAVDEMSELEAPAGHFIYEAGEIISANDPIYVSNGLAYIANDRPCDYISTSNSDVGEAVYCLNRGRFGFLGTNGLDLWNLDGVLSNTLPTKRNVFYQRLGKMLSATIVELNIEGGAWNV